jgi:hypothetical protein
MHGCLCSEHDARALVLTVRSTTLVPHLGETNIFAKLDADLPAWEMGTIRREASSLSGARPTT